MGLMDKARQTAEQARTGILGDRPPTEDVDPDAPPPPPPSARAGAALNAFIEKINPGLLADLIIHATSAQEKANKALRDKGSQYRISEMYLTASIPPQVGFYISRLGDAEEVAAPLPALEAPAPVKKKAATPAKAAAPAKKRAPRPAGP
jgi:hypothetical protein